METLGLQAAQHLVGKALEMASANYARPICAAVVDAQGFLLAFARMDGAPLRSIAISQGKAYSAVRMGVNTDAFLARLRRENIEARYFCDEGLTALPGGCVLNDSRGTMLGGIGISGLTSLEDQAIGEVVAQMVAKGDVG
jgi:uncharacterized protein GlcG (DUF336 family)